MTMKAFRSVALVGISLQAVLGKGLWSSAPAEFTNVITESYPIGNGKLGGMYLT